MNLLFGTKNKIPQGRSIRSNVDRPVAQITNKMKTTEGDKILDLMDLKLLILSVTFADSSRRT